MKAILKHIIKLIYLIHLCILLSFKLSGYSRPVNFEKIDPNGSLSEISITNTIQDSYGFIWFCTIDGLVRYDGYTFKVIQNIDTAGNQLENNEISCIIETSDSTLLLGTHYTGIRIFNRKSERFISYQNIEGDTTSLINNYITSIYQDKKQNIWIGTRIGLELFNKSKGTFTHNIPFPDSGQSNIISDITEDSNGILWLFCSISKQFLSFNPETRIFKPYTYTNNLYTNMNWTGGCIMCDGNENVWLGSEFEGVFCYNKNADTVYKVEKLKHITRQVSTFLFDESNEKSNLWIGYDGAGLVKYNLNSEELIHYTTGRNQDQLSSNAIYSLYKDNQDAIWIGMYASGVNVYKPNKLKFNSITIHGNSSRRLNQKSVLSIAQSQDKKILLGTDGGGLHIYNPQKDIIEKIFSSIYPEYPQIITSLLITKGGSIWLGTWNDGVYELSPDYKIQKHLIFNNPDKSRNISSTNIWSMQEDRNGAIWIGAYSTGLDVYFPYKDTLMKDILHEHTIDASNDIFKIFIDSKDRVWVSNGVVGLFLFEPGEYKSFRRISNTNESSNYFKFIQDIIEDSKGNFWFATRHKGLIKLTDVDNVEYKIFSIDNILPTNNILSIQEDKDQNLWMGTDIGLIEYKLQQDTIIQFDKEDGIQGDRYNAKSALIDSSGNLYFGGTKGVNFFNPNEITYNKIKPKIVFTSLKIYDEVIESGQVYNGRKYLSNPLYLTDTLYFTHKDAVFQIEFAALDYTSPTENKYKYIMEGYDEQWTNTSYQHRFATYTNLPANTYTFRVQACNNDDVWNNEGASITIIVLPPWWNTLWFKIYIVVLIIISTITIFRIRVRVLIQQKQKLETEVLNRTNEISQQKEELKANNEELHSQSEKLKEKTEKLEESNATKDKLFSIIAHDLKNPFSVILGIIDLLKQNYNILNEEKRVKYIDTIHKASYQTYDLLENLLTWSRTQQQSIVFSPKIYNASEIASQVIEQVNLLAEKKRIQIISEIESNALVKADKEMLITILRNIITNSIKFTPEKGKITFGIKMTENSTILSITDTGVGMNDSTKENLFKISKNRSHKGTNNESGTGLGMIITKEFIDNHLGEIQVESTIGKGSCFTIIFPR